VAQLLLQLDVDIDRPVEAARPARAAAVFVQCLLAGALSKRPSELLRKTCLDDRPAALWIWSLVFSRHDLLTHHDLLALAGPKEVARAEADDFLPVNLGHCALGAVGRGWRREGEKQHESVGTYGDQEKYPLMSQRLQGGHLSSTSG